MGSRVSLVDLRETRLDAGEVLAAVDHDAAGGVVLFSGRVRDHDHGRGVRALDYSAHPSVVEAMRSVCEAVAARHDVRRVAALHAVGRLRIGDVAVLVAASADHRGTAFEAARDLIDTIKAEVPIWKRQELDDGTDEWVGSP